MTPETQSLLRDAIGAAQAIILAWIAYKTVVITKSQVTSTAKIETLEKNTNSIKDALVATTKHAAFAAGVKDEKDRTHEVNRLVEEAKKIAP